MPPVFYENDDIGASSNGRTPDSGSGCWGSNPCAPAEYLMGKRQIYKIAFLPARRISIYRKQEGAPANGIVVTGKR